LAKAAANIREQWRACIVKPPPDSSVEMARFDFAFGQCTEGIGKRRPKRRRCFKNAKRWVGWVDSLPFAF